MCAGGVVSMGGLQGSGISERFKELEAPPRSGLTVSGLS